MPQNHPPWTWRGDNDDDRQRPIPVRGSQTSRNPRDLRPSLERGVDLHVRDCLIWDTPSNPQLTSDERKRLKKRAGRQRRHCCSDNRCNETFYRRRFCREHHCKDGSDDIKDRRRSCTSPAHCTERPCKDELCSLEHCHNNDCPDRAGCRERNCRTCRGVDARTQRDVGYVRRIELGRPKDRGMSWSQPAHETRRRVLEEGSAAEAISGWPRQHKRHGLLEPLITRPVKVGEELQVNDKDPNGLDEMMNRKLQLTASDKSLRANDQQQMPQVHSRPIPSSRYTEDPVFLNERQGRMLHDRNGEVQMTTNNNTPFANHQQSNGYSQRGYEKGGDDKPQAYRQKLTHTLETDTVANNNILGNADYGRGAPPHHYSQQNLYQRSRDYGNPEYQEFPTNSDRQRTTGLYSHHPDYYDHNEESHQTDAYNRGGGSNEFSGQKFQPYQQDQMSYGANNY